ncbi:uncharacterized protein J3R85_012032, partial [Psidium guajava]
DDAWAINQRRCEFDQAEDRDARDLSELGGSH